jgi:hypothetical protein
MISSASRTVAGLAAVAGRDGALHGKGRFELGKRLHACVAAHALVGGKGSIELLSLTLLPSPVLTATFERHNLRP